MFPMPSIPSLRVPGGEDYMSEPIASPGPRLHALSDSTLSTVITSYAVRTSDWDTAFLSPLITSVSCWPGDPAYDTAPSPGSLLSLHIACGTVNGFIVVEKMVLSQENNSHSATHVVRLEVPDGQAVVKMCCALELGVFLFTTVSLELHILALDDQLVPVGKSPHVITGVQDFALRSEFPRSTLAVLSLRSVRVFYVCAEDSMASWKPSATLALEAPCTTCILASHLLVCGGRSLYLFFELLEGGRGVRLVHSKPTQFEEKGMEVRPLLTHVGVPTAKGGIMSKEMLFLQCSSHMCFRFKVSAVPCSSAVLDIRRTVSLLTRSVAPLSLHGIGPFLLSVTPNCMEVYHIESCKLVQTLDIVGITAVSSPTMLELDRAPSFLWDDTTPFSPSGQMHKILFVFHQGGCSILRVKNLLTLERELIFQRNALAVPINEYLTTLGVSDKMPPPRRGGISPTSGKTSWKRLWFLPDWYLEETPLIEPERLASRAHWEDDKLRPMCANECGLTFTIMTRRHHCRKCGRVFCSKCCLPRRQEDLLQMGYQIRHVGELKNERLCTSCFAWCDKNIYILLLHERYHDAFEYCREHSELVVGYAEGTPSFLGVRVLECLMMRRNYDLCASLLRKVLGNNNELWEEWALQFFERRAIRSLLPYLPNPRECDSMDNRIYTTVLCHLVRDDAEMLYATVRKWKYTDGLYDIIGVLCTIEGYLLVRRQEILKDQMADDDTLVAIGGEYLTTQVDFVMRAALTLHRFVSTPEQLLRFYVANYFVFTPFETDGGGAGKGNAMMEVTSYMEQHNLWKALLPPNSLLRPLVRRQRNLVANYVLTILNTQKVKVGDFVDQLSPYPEERLAILHTLTEIQVASTSVFHNSLIQLYIKYMPEGLLSFVKHRDLSNIDWRAAAEMTRERRLFKEYAYILGKTGNFMQAVRVIVRCLKDVKYGLEYIYNVGDEDGSLCAAFCAHVAQSPKLIGELIDHATENQDVLSVSQFLKAIPGENRLRVPMVAERLAETFKITNADRNISHATLSSMVSSNYALQEEFLVRTTRAVSVDTDSYYSPKCGYCGETVYGGDYLLAACSHVMHPTCVAKAHAKVSLDRVKPQRHRVKRTDHVTRLTPEFITRLNTDADFSYASCDSSIIGLPYNLCRYVFCFLPRATRYVGIEVSKSWHSMSLDALYGPYIVEHTGYRVAILSEVSNRMDHKYYRRYAAPFAEVRPIVSHVPRGVAFHDTTWLLKAPVQCPVCVPRKLRE